MSNTILEFKISSKDQIDKIITDIKSNFAKDASEQDSVIIRYDESVSEVDLLETLSSLWELERTCGHTIDILIKNLSYSLRVKAMSLALKTENLINPIFLMNVFCLVKGYNTFEESYFEHEQVFVNDEVEFLDIFDDLEEELKVVTNKVAEYYISMLKTCNLVEAVENNPNSVNLPDLYVYLFNAMDFTILARILSLVKDPTIWETKKIVLNSLNYLSAISEKFVFSSSIMEMIGSEIMKQTVSDVIKETSGK